MNISQKIQSVSASPTLAIDAKYKEMKAQGVDVVGFGAGEPDFETPQNIKDAAIKAINDGLTRYTPASGTLDLRKAVAEKFKNENGLCYEPTQIIISNGAKHSLVNALMALLNPGEEVIIPAPFWVSYIEMIKIADGVPHIIETSEENNFKFTPNQLEEAINEKTKALILNSPSNPTGMVYTKEELEEIANICVKHDIYVISDEIYEKLIYEGEHISIGSLNDEIMKRTITINGVSKSYAMTGWRIGFAAAPAHIAKAMANLQSHAASNPNSIAQAATIEALKGPQDEVEKMRLVFAQRRINMCKRINSIDGVSCKEPQGAFYIMMNITKLFGRSFYGQVIDSSDKFAEVFLENAKVAVVPGSGFGADGYVRWSYATSEENINEGLNRLEEFLKHEDK
ncbi:MAG: pyridoxal phosphate-dependent aminotransferase [Clostridia bacterium]|nr:pyridoxal phosphate-dependent aminotransferase [Clostridia bacterium]